ncbi:hypothetical protein GCM10020255_108980 [Rhodococcus baikonurensis]
MTTNGSRTTVLTNIGTLVTNDPTLGEGKLGVRHDAAIVFDDGVVAWVGDSADAPAADIGQDIGGRALLPGFVESHSHLVFGGERAEEFAARMAGEKYAAGGIRNTIEATRSATDEQLQANVRRLLDESLRSGSTTVECKTGYGQNTESELRSALIAGQFTDEVTLLAAHVPPPEYAGRADDYVAMACDEMIPACAPHAKWIDVFCERGAFNREQAHAVLSAGVAAGLIPASTETNSAKGQESSSPSRWVPRPSITSPTSPPKTSMSWLRVPPSQHCCPAPTSPPATSTPTPAHFWTPESP